MLHTKYQPNIPCHSGEKVDLIGFAIFSIGSHLGFRDQAEFYHSETLKSGHAACDGWLVVLGLTAL